MVTRPMARTSEEEQKRLRRKRLIKGLLLGSAAVGLPAALNALVARSRPQLRAASWGRTNTYASKKGSISFRQLGTGPAMPVVLLHSFGPGHDSEEWRSIAETLAATRPVWVPDLLGWGLSERPALSYDGELYVELLVDFLSDVVRQRAVVVAAGLTAAYTVQVAVDHPELVAAAAVVAPAGIEIQADEPDLKDALVHRLLRLPIIGTSALNLYTSHNALAQYLRREVFAAPERADASRVDHYYRSSHQPGAHHALAALLSGYLNHSVEEIVERLTQPLWLAWGSESSVPRIETADLWLAQVAHAELEVFAGTRGVPHLELPDTFAAKLTSFIDRSGDQ